MNTVWLISGTPGAGKTSVSEALCRRYKRAVHIPVDDLREWVRSGYASPIDPTVDRDVLREQFMLARGSAARMAADYSAAGFAVVIDDVITSFAHEPYEALVRVGARRVLLAPSVDVAVSRNRDRTNKTFDTAILEPVTRDLHEVLGRDRPDRDNWVVVDSSRLSVEETVDAIVARCGL